MGQRELLFEDFFTEGVNLIVYVTTMERELPQYEKGIMVYPGCPASHDVDDYAMEVPKGSSLRIGTIANTFNTHSTVFKEFFVEAIDPDIQVTINERLSD